MSRLFLFGVHLLAAALAAAATGCSGASATPVAATPVAPTPAPTPTPSGPPTITITSTGMQPLELTISVGQRVLWINGDVRPHDVVGGIDPAHPDCPEILEAGFLAPGQRSETGVFRTAKTCEYHDHTQLSVAAFQGRIFIK